MSLNDAQLQGITLATVVHLREATGSALARRAAAGARAGLAGASIGAAMRHPARLSREERAAIPLAETVAREEALDVLPRDANSDRAATRGKLTDHERQAAESWRHAIRRESCTLEKAGDHRHGDQE